MEADIINYILTFCNMRKIILIFVFCPFLLNAQSVVSILSGKDSLRSLLDVLLNNPTSGQYLSYNGTKWVNVAAPGGATTLASLTDVQLTSPTNGQYFTYNGFKWVNSAAPISSQWITSGSNIYYNTGYVGVGTPTPIASIHLGGTYNLNTTNARWLNWPTINMQTQPSYFGFESIATVNLGANNQVVSAFNGVCSPNNVGTYTLNSSDLPTVFRAQSAINACVLSGVQGNPTGTTKPPAMRITQNGVSNNAPFLYILRSGSANGDFFRIDQPRVSTETPQIFDYNESSVENQGDRVDIFNMSTASKSFAGIFKHYKVDIGASTYTTAFGFETMSNNSLLNSLKIVGNSIIVGGDNTTTQTTPYVAAFIGTSGISLPTGTTAQRPTAAAGVIRHNTDLNKFEGVGTGAVYYPFVQTLFSSTSNAVVSNTTAITSLASVSIPANSLAAGQTLRINLEGFMSTLSPTPGKGRIGIVYGTDTIYSTNDFLRAVTGNKSVIAEFTVRVSASGASGAVRAQGFFNQKTDTTDPQLFGGWFPITTPTTANNTVDTTTTKTLTVFWQWATADINNSISITNAVIKRE